MSLNDELNCDIFGAPIDRPWDVRTWWDDRPANELRSAVNCTPPYWPKERDRILLDW